MLAGASACKAAIAAQRAKYIPSQTLGMYPHQRNAGADITHDEGHSSFELPPAAFAELAFKAQNTKCAPASREVGFRNLANRT